MAPCPSPGAQLVAVSAFVTLNTVEAKAALLSSFPRGLRSLFPFLTPEASKFRGTHVLTAAPAPDPSDVLWQNIHVRITSTPVNRLLGHAVVAKSAPLPVTSLQVTPLQKTLRRTLALVVTLALLLVTAGCARRSFFFLIFPIEFRPALTRTSRPVVTGAREFQTHLPPAVACSALAPAGLPCDAVWNLTSSSSNSAVRATVASLAQLQPSSGCAPFVDPSSGVFTANVVTWTAAGAAGDRVVLPGLANSSVVSCAAAVCQGCYCEAQGLTKWLYKDDGLRSYCAGFWHNYLSTWAFKLASIFVVLVINSALCRASREREHTSYYVSRSCSRLMRTAPFLQWSSSTSSRRLRGSKSWTRTARKT